VSDDDWPTPLPRPDDGEHSGTDASAFSVYAPPEPTADEMPAGAEEIASGQRGFGAHGPPTAGGGATAMAAASLGAANRGRGGRRVGPLGWAGFACLCVWLVAMPLTSTVTELRQNTQLVVAVLAVLGVNIATGYGGMISLGHGVFVAVGAFGAAYAVDNLGLPWVISLLAGAVIAGAFGALVGLPALRIRGIHLALVTLGLAIVFQPLAKRFPAFSGGVSGRAVDAELVPPSWFGTSRWSAGLYRYIICVAVVALVLRFAYNLINSRPGRAMRAVRDNATAGAVHGVNLVTTRVATFAVSASIAGLAGALGVILVPFTSQESYPPQESLVLYAMAVLGGLGSIWGSVAGVAIREVAANAGAALARLDGLGPLSELLDLFEDERFLFGVALIALTFAFPRGLAGLLSRHPNTAVDSAAGQPKSSQD